MGLVRRCIAGARAGSQSTNDSVVISNVLSLLVTSCPSETVFGNPVTAPVRKYPWHEPYICMHMMIKLK